MNLPFGQYDCLCRVLNFYASWDFEVREHFNGWFNPCLKMLVWNDNHQQLIGRMKRTVLENLGIYVRLNGKKCHCLTMTL